MKKPMFCLLFLMASFGAGAQVIGKFRDQIGAASFSYREKNLVKPAFNILQDNSILFFDSDLCLKNID